MRGRKTSQTTMLTLVAPEQRVPKSHPRRRIKDLADATLQALSPTFDAMYAEGGRPSVPPERLLESTLLAAFYSVRSDRLFCEQLDDNLLFRWFLDMDMVEESFNHSTFSKNRERLLEHEVASAADERRPLGWAKTVACFRKTRFRGRARTQLAAHLVAAAYNLLRISKLMPA